ncbi:uncharacterized protein LOC108036672 [Drosophila biarmipes]|uniref:uncharacterized protein LOC108036672 n=1 Tax=Drosophila biarmipes TaxID=125945 RepID=UPI0007E836E9|nr:uncharacterized protein LOC108036672 [Drosophila biarmipes]
MANKCRCGALTLGGENRGVFCEGPLLDAVQRSKMFPDCKHFVDMSCIFTPAQTLADFDMFSNCRKNDGSLRFLQMFVEKHFNDPGSELEPWDPPDWKAQPSFLIRISDPEIKHFGSDVNRLWRQLGRRIKDEVKENPDHYSILYTPNPFIVPSSDCREYRYWDSFWIVRGLLQCGMHQTARGMIDNYLSLVEQYGFVPGCGRIYCSGRSNPPLLIMMVKAYVEVTRDEKYALRSLPLLETEYDTFISKHSVQVKGKTMYQYRDSSAGPRPEAYREDLESVASIKCPVSREVMYTELKSASESGMDFSSRWFVTADGSNEGTLRDTKTSAIVPVELNAIVFRSGKILAEFNRKAGNTQKAEEYQDKACALVKAIRDNLWNAQAGIWLDYDLVNNKPRNYFCCTNFAPLWARAFPLVDTDKVSKGVMQYIRINQLDEQYGGVPHTMNKESGQKWDYPNVFPPMMFLVVEGLDNLGTPQAKAMSKRWAHRWVKSNYAAYKYESFMFEKYFCEEFGTSGGASPEHTPVGYGWTNGVVIEFLCKYGKDISLADDLDEGCKCKARGAKTAGGNEYIITSEANMEEQPSKKSCVCGAPSTVGTTSNKSSTGTSTRNSVSNGNQKQQQTDDDCTCGIAQKQRAQAQHGADGTCSCGPGAHQQMQSNNCGPQKQQQSQTQMQRSQLGQQGADCACGARSQHQPQQKSQQQFQGNSAGSCGICGSQKPQQSQAQMQRSQMGKHGADCSCGAKPQQQQHGLLGRGAPSAASCGVCETHKHQQSQTQMQRSSADQDCSGVAGSQQAQQGILGMQHDPDCPCSGQQQKGAGLIVVPRQQPLKDDDCECSMDERELQQMQQQQKQQDCKQQQRQQQQENQRLQQQLECEQKQQDCTSKPQPQDCSQHLKSQQQTEGPCGCMDEEDAREQHDQGHYFPVTDKEDEGCSAEETPRDSGCDGCGRDDCPDSPQEDSGCNGGQEKVQPVPIPQCAQPKPQQYAAPDDCGCSAGQGQGRAPPAAPPTTSICPHCGGITTESQTNWHSTHSVGTNRPSFPHDDDCECSKVGGGAGGQQMRAMGVQSGHSKGVMASGGGPECGPCKAHMPSDYAAGHGPKPFYNKQFPLADPVSTAEACPTTSEPIKKKKCCNCDEKEDE